MEKLRSIYRIISASQFVRSRVFRVLVLAFGEIGSAVVGLASMMVLVRILSKSEYAVYVQAMLVYSTFLPLLGLGLPKTLFVLLPRHKDHTRKMLFENQMILITIGLSFSAFMLLGGSGFIAKSFNDTRLESALPYLALYFLFSLPLSSIDSALLSQNKTITLSLFDVFSRTLLFICAITAVYWWPDPKAALLGLVIGSLINFIIGTILMYRANNRGPFYPSLASIRSHFALGAPLLLATSFGVLQSSLDKWIVAIFDTPENFAAFSIGATQIPFIGYFTGSVAQVLLADSAKYFHENRQGEVAELLWRATLSSATLLLPIMCYFWATADVVIPWLFSDQYVDSVAPFMLYLLLIPARLINYSSVEIASGKTFVVPLIFGVNAVLVALFTILLYPKSGYLSAIYANLIVTYLFSIPAHFWVMTKLLKLPLFPTFPRTDFVKLLVVIGISSSVLLIKSWLPIDEHIKIFVIGGVYFTFVIILIMIFRINIPILKVLGDRVLQKIRDIE